jgi:uncharacterized protein YecE (DUF72 family)
VPATFRFAAKLPKTITHQRKLIDCAGLLDAFLYEIAPLGEKLGPLLVQLPPSLAFDMAIVDSFLQALRARFAGRVVCEPRHPTWFDDDADATLALHGVARVAADPARTSEAGWPGGARDLAYFRLHGSPRMYFSAYGNPFLDDLAARLAAEAPAEAWCIFDNTASGAAAADALALKERLGV